MYTPSITLGSRVLFSCVVWPMKYLSSDVAEETSGKAARKTGHFEDSKPGTAREKPLTPRVSNNLK